MCSWLHQETDTAQACAGAVITSSPFMCSLSCDSASSELGQCLYDIGTMSCKRYYGFREAVILACSGTRSAADESTSAPPSSPSDDTAVVVGSVVGGLLGLCICIVIVAAVMSGVACCGGAAVVGGAAAATAAVAGGGAAGTTAASTGLPVVVVFQPAVQPGFVGQPVYMQHQHPPYPGYVYHSQQPGAFGPPVVVGVPVAQYQP
jgi:hypothetical protein